MIGSAAGDVILIGSDDDNSCRSGTSRIERADSSRNAHLRNDLDSLASTTASVEDEDAKRRGVDPRIKIIIDVDASMNLDDDVDGYHSSSPSSSSSSSSSSSGIPSPWEMANRASPPPDNRPPPVVRAIHSTGAFDATGPSSEVERERWSKNASLADDDGTMYREDETSRTDKSTTPSVLSETEEDRPARVRGRGPEGANPAVGKRKPGKRRWGRSKRGAAPAASGTGRCADGGVGGEDRPPSTKSKVGTDPAETPDRHFHCYLLRSLDPDHPLKTYIGFTTHPQRRIRQHNGILKNAGARRTKISGRPWTFVCVIHGFQDKITALQFEWAWQNVNKSLAFREAVGDDMLANKMKRRYGPNARLEELRVLLKECLPFCLYSLTVYFPESKYYHVFYGMLKRGKNGNPYKKDDDETDEHDSLMSIEVCSLENMPVAKEAAMLKENKKAKQEAGKIHTQHRSKSTKSESDISDWLEDAKSIAKEGSCWSDSLDDEVGSNCVNLNTIEEKDSFMDLNDGSRESGEYDVDDDDETDEHESLTSIEVCLLKNMPVAKEAATSKEKKKAKQEAEKIHKQHQEKSTKSESDISDWLEDAKSIAKEGSCWSDLLDDEVVSNCVGLNTIEEKDSSIDLNDGSSESGEYEVDDLSKAVVGLSMDASEKQAPVDNEGCDFSTISSADSTFSLDGDEPEAVTKELPERSEKENRVKNRQLFDSATNTASLIGKIGNVGSNSDVVDLCNSP
jgi:hypothetical protein